MSKVANPQGGLNLGNDMLRVFFTLNVRFASDVLILANTMEDVQHLFLILATLGRGRVCPKHLTGCGDHNGSTTAAFFISNGIAT